MRCKTSKAVNFQKKKKHFYVKANSRMAKNEEMKVYDAEHKMAQKNKTKKKLVLLDMTVYVASSTS
jgi:hypothetical protein